MSRIVFSLACLLACAGPASADSVCAPDGKQASGSIYRLCMPPAAEYNGMLVIWAHGFQDAGTPVSIPEEQLCVEGLFCLPELINGLGFAFATNSYSKTGLAVVQGKDDILDLVDIFTARHGKPAKVYLVGASEGGIITTLAVEQHPEIFSGGVAACGPIGDFAQQINYFGDARATFQVFFPGVIPGDPWNPDPQLVAAWSEYYEQVVKPIVLHPASRSRLDQWVSVARLPFDPANYLATIETSVKDVLRYSIVNLRDAAVTLGGFPFGNAQRWYSGSASDLLLNQLVPRRAASPVALADMAARYSTTGVLARPLITIHTLGDQQVPYWHEQLYQLKTLASGAFLTRHLNIPISRFEHCNFTADELLFSFALMLFYDAQFNATDAETVLRNSTLASIEQRRASVRSAMPRREPGATGPAGR